MSDPTPNFDQPVHSAVHEIISAMSALNMPPSPETDEAMLADIEKKQGVVYLSQSDKWAAHAMEHLQTAVELLRTAKALAKKLT